jgi:hypothetical protein
LEAEWLLLEDFMQGVGHPGLFGVGDKPGPCGDHGFVLPLQYVSDRHVGRIDRSTGIPGELRTARLKCRLSPLLLCPGLGHSEAESASLSRRRSLRRSRRSSATNARTLRDADEISAVLTYDQQLRRGCEHHGLPVESP